MTRKMRLVALLGAWLVAAAAVLCLAGPGVLVDARDAALGGIDRIVGDDPAAPTLAHLTPPPTALFVAARERK